MPTNENVARYRREHGDRDLERRIEVRDDDGLTVRFYARDGDDSFDRTLAWPEFVALLASVEASAAAVDGSLTERVFVDGEMHPTVIGRDPGPKITATTAADGGRRDRLCFEAPADGGAANEETGTDDDIRLSIRPVPDGTVDGETGDDLGWTVTDEELATLLTPAASSERDDLVAEAGFSEALRRAVFVYRDSVIVRELL